MKGIRNNWGLARTVALFIIVFCSFHLHLIAQPGTRNSDSWYSPGTEFPNLEFRNVQFADFTSAKISDFRGKWILLDFFTTGCTACFKLMPEINSFLQEHKEQLQVIMIGKNTHDLPKLYDIHRKKKNLQLPVVFVDSAYWSRFDICGLPHALLIDPHGKLKSVSAGIDTVNLSAFVSGKTPKILQKKSCSEMEKVETMYSWDRPLFFQGNGGPERLLKFRSQLTGFSGSRGMIPDYFEIMKPAASDTALKDIAWFEATYQSLSQLYKLAYGDTLPDYPESRSPKNVYGKQWRKPLLEVKDSLSFQSSWLSADKLYNYSLIVPKEKGDVAFMQKLMQADLERYFGYRAVVEERMMPCWLLTAQKDARQRMESLWTKNLGRHHVDKTFQMVPDVSVKEFLGENGIYHTYLANEPPIIDQTGIDFRFNIFIDAVQEDTPALMKALRQNGLNLVKSQRMMRVIVIRDKDR